MKSFTFGLLMLVACAAALPQVSVTDFGAERRDVAEIIVNAFERLKERIINRGLDPYELQRAQGEYVFILPSIFSASGIVENLRLDGLSNIVVNSISYSPSTNDLTIDVSMPSLMLIVGNAAFEVTALGRQISGSLSGLLAINGFGVSGSAKVSLLNPGVTVTEIDVNARLDSFQHVFAVRFLDMDLSPAVNNWLNSLPANLALYKDLINRGLGRIIGILLEHFLNNYIFLEKLIIPAKN